MADIDKRLRYYDGQFLQEQDFSVEQEYHLDRQRRHNRQLHTYGIAEGLTVAADFGATTATVSPGTAIDGEGRSIVLTEPRSVPFGSLRGSVLVVISYSEQTSDPATEGEVAPTRFWERPDVRAIADDDDTPAPNDRIQLARLHIDADGTVDEPQDPSVRTMAGVKLGTELPIERIRLLRQGVAPSLWPVLSSGAPGQADVVGNLSVTGNVLVTGTLDGRDVAADGQRLDAHVTSTDNPHNTTAAQLGAITGVGGVSNPGGQVALQAGNNISITPDSTNKRITIASSTLKGVSNPGGNIDLVGLGGITVTGNDTTNSITIATSLALLGAFPSSDYLKRAFGAVVFSDGNLDGATMTVSCGFQPKLVLSTGMAEVNWSDVWSAAPCSGYAKVDSSTAVSHGTRWSIRRIDTAPFFTTRFGDLPASEGRLGQCEFEDRRSSTRRHNHLYLEIMDVTSNDFKVRLGRTTTNNSFSEFRIRIALCILG